MKYDHEMWDVIMKLFDYAEKRLEERGGGIMLAEVSKLHEQAMNGFSLHRDQIAWFLQYFSGEDCLNVPPGLDRLDDAEVEASKGDIQASSTENGKKAVKAAQKRLEERERMRPVIEAEEKLRAAEQIRKDKDIAAQRDKDERDRPGRELKEAQKAEQAAEDEVKKAAELVQKAKP